MFFFRLAGRLHEISKAEGLGTDLTALLALACKTHNDIRSCLSLLQFVRWVSGGKVWFFLNFRLKLQLANWTSSF